MPKDNDAVGDVRSLEVGGDDISARSKRDDPQRPLLSTGEGAVFVAFGVEIANGLGKEARAFYMQCLEWANGHNDVDSCHWIAMSFRRHWNMRFGVLLSRERARIGLAAAKGATTKMRRQLGTTDTEPGGMS